MLTKNDLEKLSETRLNDAIHLLRGNKASSAYYLAGYAVELGLKVCISKLFQENVIPDKNLVNATYTHSLEALMATSGLLPQLKKDMKNDAVFSANWGIVTKWNEHSRYEFWDAITATSLITAIIDQDHGVYPWVKKHW